ncbi:MAG: hypothetical protein CVU03_04980 [Bacteroidetes bacterium HGW-Bacteroidetes-2]|jgi:hypothetical protein|nr:MAG: hypothetical protein CVU03_04980 [Bacteroidetes bacterium HGW-Bacteroidetes-2]
MARDFKSKLSVLGEQVLTRQTKSVTIVEMPEQIDMTLFFTEKAITIQKVAGVLMGSASPSLDFNIHYAATRDATGTKLTTADMTLNSTTSGNIITSFNNASIPANSWVWLVQKTGFSGTVNQMHLTVFFTENL